ncbi:MAG TPA: ABC transporter ATP-binding protein [Treponemataceae bacterium]|nr:ABC transporter ATP-binding protein [Treponemataceae bacterium]
MSKNTIISLSRVSKIYFMGDTEVHALRRVSFDVGHGEFISIMGPSGSGKSTCMNIIGCLDRPTKGSVSINGRLTAKMNEKELAHLRNKTVGFVFQHYHLLPTMTVLENVMLPLRYQGLSISARKKRAEEALDMVGLSDRLAHKSTELSGGQKQRVAIARATATHPQIILADEPTGALDSETGKNIMSLFRKINKRGTTVVVITHNQGLGNSADRCIEIFDGNITSDGKTNKQLARHLKVETRLRGV